MLILNNTAFDHLELFCRKRIRIINAQEGSLCFFNEGTSPTSLFIHSKHPTVDSKWF